MGRCIMTAAETKAVVAVGFTDYEFVYKGVRGSICPFNKKDGSFVATVSYGGFYKDFENLEELMRFKIIGGRSFSELAEEIEWYG